MYEYLEGRVDEVGATWAVLDVAGVGWHLNISSRLAGLLSVEETRRFPVHLAVSESSQTLFAFENATERALFRRLIQVSGIGPASAIGLLCSLPPEEMVRAILEQDTKRLTAMKGVGRKTAERLVVELRDHLEDLLPSGTGKGEHRPAERPDGPSDLERVLLDLGASPAAATSAADRTLEELGPEADFQELLRHALGLSS